MPVTSNYIDVNRALGVLSGAFAMRRRVSEGKRLGDEVAELVAATIEERTRVQKVAPDRSPLAELKLSSLLRKVRKGFPPVLGVETGAMLDKGEIQGEVTLSADSVAMVYGLDEETRQEAEWFQEGKAHQAPRPFYELGDDGEERLVGYIDEVAEAARVVFEGE